MNGANGEYGEIAVFMHGLGTVAAGRKFQAFFEQLPNLWPELKNEKVVTWKFHEVNFLGCFPLPL